MNFKNYQNFPNTTQLLSRLLGYQAQLKETTITQNKPLTNNPSMVDLKLKINKILYASIWGFYKPTLKSLDSNPNTCISTQMRLKGVLKTNLHLTYTYVLT